MVQLMPLPLTVSCFSKIQIGFTFLVPAYPDSPGQRAVKPVLGDTFLATPCSIAVSSRHCLQFLVVFLSVIDVSLLIVLDCGCGCVGSCWKEHIAVVVLNTVLFMVRQLLTQREFSGCLNTLNTCMLISIQVLKCCYLFISEELQSFFIETLTAAVLLLLLVNCVV